MLKPIIGEWYMIGPHPDGLYSREKIIRIIDDATVIASMGDNHQHRYELKEIVREASSKGAEWWYTKREVYE